MGLFQFSDKDFSGGNLLLENGQYLFEIVDVQDTPKKKKPDETNTQIDFKCLARISEDGSLVEDSPEGVPYKDFRPVRNWYSAPWTILPLFTALGVNVAPGAKLEATNDTLKGSKILLDIGIGSYQKDGKTVTKNEINGYSPYIP